MKKITALFISLFILLSALPTNAASYYLQLSDYPYSTHVLGDDLVIYASTNAPVVVLGLYSLTESGAVNSFKFSMTLYASELKNGYTIPTGTLSDGWSEGDYLIIAQYGTVRDEAIIRMTSSPVYNRNVRIATYSHDALTSVATYRCRGVLKHDNMLEFSLEDSTVIKVFSWNTLSPTPQGHTTLYVALYQDGYMLSAKNYTGELDTLSSRFTLEISPTERLEFFLWNDTLSPI